MTSSISQVPGGNSSNDTLRIGTPRSEPAGLANFGDSGSPRGVCFPVVNDPDGASLLGQLSRRWERRFSSRTSAPQPRQIDINGIPVGTGADSAASRTAAISKGEC